MNIFRKAMSKIQESKTRSANLPNGKSKNPTGSRSLHIAHMAEPENSPKNPGNHGEPQIHSELEVNWQVLRDAGLIPPDHHEQLLTNQFREIKRPLLAHAFGKRTTQIENGNLIMVTSALAGEGKTFTSINLALSIAQEKDHSVLLVDADVAKPQASELFGTVHGLGLLDLLEDRKLHIESVVLPTDVEGLSVLPAGQPRTNSTELLSSSRMDEVASFLASRTAGGVIVIDSSPLLQTSDSKAVAGIAGQILLVVRAGDTAQEAVVAAIHSIGRDKAVSLILNQVRGNDGRYPLSYEYGYSDDYGQGTSEGSTRDWPR